MLLAYEDELNVCMFGRRFSQNVAEDTSVVISINTSKQEVTINSKVAKSGTIQQGKCYDKK